MLHFLNISVHNIRQATQAYYTEYRLRSKRTSISNADSSSSSSRDHTGDIDPQWRNVDCCM